MLRLFFAIAFHPKFCGRQVGPRPVNIYAVMPLSSLRQSRALEQSRTSRFAARLMARSERVVLLGFFTEAGVTRAVSEMRRAAKVHKGASAEGFAVALTQHE